MRWLRRLRYSLSARLLLLFVVVGALIATILSVAIGAAISHQFKRNIRPHIVQYLEYVREDIGDPPDIAKAEALARRVPVAITIRGPEINWASGGEALDLSEVHFHRHSDGNGYYAAADEDARFILKTRAGDHEVYFVVESPRHSRSRWVGLLAIAAMLLVLYAMYRIIRWLFQPLQAIQQGVRRIGEGKLKQRIVVRRRDELGDLSDSINAMAAEIEKMLEAKRQLLLAISHELRSPVTRARVSLALLDDTREKQAVVQDLQEMERLIGDLLESERLHTRHNALNRVPVAINALVREVIAEHFAGQALQVALSEHDPYVLLDPARIKLLLKNILENALRYSRTDRPPPQIVTEVSGRALTLRVRDHGSGIAPEHLAHLSEPFYRADPSRQRKTGGYGLGLYLCRAIAEAHGGELVVQSEVNRGTAITVTIPFTATIARHPDCIDIA